MSATVRLYTCSRCGNTCQIRTWLITSAQLYLINWQNWTTEFDGFQWIYVWRSIDSMHYNMHTMNCFNTLRLRQKCRHFIDISKCIFLNEIAWTSLKIFLKFVPEVRINTIAALVKIMAWYRPGAKPLSEPILVYWRIYSSRLWCFGHKVMVPFGNKSKHCDLAPTAVIDSLLKLLSDVKGPVNKTAWRKTWPVVYNG